MDGRSGRTLMQRLLAILLLLVVRMPVAQASDSAQFVLQETIERRVMLLMQQYDKDALAFAQVTYESHKDELPATPFVVGGELEGDDQPKVQAIHIAVHTRLKPVPAEIQALVRAAV